MRVLSFSSLAHYVQGTSDETPFPKFTDPAKIVNLESVYEVAARQNVSFDCQAEGNPQPTYAWTPCDPQQSVCDKSVLNFQAGNRSVYMFTCEVENYLDSDTRNTTLCKLHVVHAILLINNFK